MPTSPAHLLMLFFPRVQQLRNRAHVVPGTNAKQMPLLVNQAQAHLAGQPRT